MGLATQPGNLNLNSPIGVTFGTSPINKVLDNRIKHTYQVTGQIYLKGGKPQVLHFSHICCLNTVIEEG